MLERDAPRVNHVNPYLAHSGKTNAKPMESIILLPKELASDTLPENSFRIATLEKPEVFKPKPIEPKPIASKHVEQPIFKQVLEKPKPVEAVFQPIVQPIVKPVEKPVEKPIEKPNVKPVEKPLFKPIEKVDTMDVDQPVVQKPALESPKPKLPDAPLEKLVEKENVPIAKYLEGSLPSFEFGQPAVATWANNQSVWQALKAINGELPVFSFTSLPAFGKSEKPLDKPLMKPAEKPATGGFDWAAAGMKKPEEAGWKCDVCMVNNKTEATKCVSCDSPAPKTASVPTTSSVPTASRPTASSAPTTGGFNWAAAGMKPIVSNPGEWTCSVCSCKNKPDLKVCCVCETPR
jgi:hypothetical protein